MLIGRPLRFTSHVLDEMLLGSLELSVPLQGDVIPIGAGGRLDVGRLLVSKDRSTVDVRRADGQPFQVVLVTVSDESDGRRRTTRRNVFGDSVVSVTFCRLRDRWEAHCGGDVTGRTTAVSARRVKQFADTVGTFAVAKQRSTAARALGHGRGTTFIR
jgi:hypothetical protein